MSTCVFDLTLLAVLSMFSFASPSLTSSLHNCGMIYLGNINLDRDLCGN